MTRPQPSLPESPPPGIRAEAFADPNFTGTFANGALLVVYDPVTRTGGLYHAAHGYWRLWTPVLMSEFAEVAEVAVAAAIKAGALPGGSVN